MQSSEFKVWVGGALTSRLTTTLSSKVNLPRTIDLMASCGANLVTLPPKIQGGRNFGSPPCGYRGASLVRNSPPSGPYSRPMPGAQSWSHGGWRFLMSEVPGRSGWRGLRSGSSRSSAPTTPPCSCSAQCGRTVAGQTLFGRNVTGQTQVGRNATRQILTSSDNNLLFLRWSHHARRRQLDRIFFKKQL